MIFSDREAAGRALGTALDHLRPADPLLLLALPRGGVPVAYAAGHELSADLDIVLVRKLGVPWQPELAMGAIGEDGVRVLNRDVLASSRVTVDELRRVERAERAELERRVRVLRGTQPRVPVRGRAVVIVDDGMATGATATAACRVTRARGPRRIVVAVPVSSPAATRRLRTVADDVVCLAEPTEIGGVGSAYRDFHQLDDREVLELRRA
jgi:putative phosphoribosyl transferase